MNTESTDAETKLSEDVVEKQARKDFRLFYTSVIITTFVYLLISLMQFIINRDWVNRIKMIFVYIIMIYAFITLAFLVLGIRPDAKKMYKVRANLFMWFTLINIAYIGILSYNDSLLVPIIAFVVGLLFIFSLQLLYTHFSRTSRVPPK